MTEYNVNPRERMKEVRSEVKAFVKGKPHSWMAHMAHLGEYPDNMEDAVRTIIALQDLLEVSMKRHSKASDLVHKLTEANQNMAQNVFASETQHMLCHHGFEAEKADMQKAIENLQEELVITRRNLCETNSAFEDILRKYDDKQHKLTAALTTVRTLMEGGV